MKVIMVYDQIQAGVGIKDDHMTPLGVKKEVVGPAIMMEPYLKKVGGKVIACIYCGAGYYEENTEEVTRKICALIEKVKPDVVMCGPAFNYERYGNMSAHIAYAINEKTSVPALSAMSKENENTIEEFKDKIFIVETPKKGGIGLNKSLQGMCQLAKAMVNKEDTNAIVEEYCFK
ncbi:GrdB-related putative oxidoreductase [Clostridium tarantellae]|uniref:Glycine/betaine/sarcosine/D-proline family reductase selenoprotein B n=1 Tax=Clostridium tarantellae TaxID=39493 RepID=A0A6I1ML42_9CLOT|nr:GrdB-related putative oxidoreductase [Clostridium tarantellae]MPQ42942.1 glycine/betaine/sarcosine/D-proline family reductase selenoprotein B [Clostridium tarantellae]